VTEVVIEAGPGTIRGPNDAPPEWVSAALDCVDDEFALLDDRPMSVEDVWADVMTSIAGAHVATAVVVCPGWWPATRIHRVRHAAYTAATEVVLLERVHILRALFSDDATVVEIASDVAVVSASGTVAAAVPLQKNAMLDAEAVAAAIGSPAAVVVDAPVGVLGAAVLASTIADRMRAIDVPVRIADDDHVLRVSAAQRSRSDVGSEDVAAGRSHRKLFAVLSGVLTVMVLCGAFAASHQSPDDGAPMTLLVEGRIGVLVPATWTARRITSGPGSARVQVVSPADADVALHLTQSSTPRPSTLAETAAALSAALAETAAGAFVDFNASDRREDREAVTYREVRPERHVAWTVMVDGTTRIAVGCQSAPGREDLVREACDRAIRSAHAVS
jgi:type VII secretion-associated protein (TIGR03931 family)